MEELQKYIENLQEENIKKNINENFNFSFTDLNLKDEKN